MRQHLQRLQQISVGTVQKTGRKQVQQAPNLFGRLVEVLGFFASTVAPQVGPFKRVFKLTRELRQFGVAHCARTAGQRMRQRHGGVAHWAMLLQRPFSQLDPQTARQLVRLVEVDVEQRDTDAQRPDLAVGLGIGGGRGVGFGLNLELGFGADGNQRLGRRHRHAGQLGRDHCRWHGCRQVGVQRQVQDQVRHRVLHQTRPQLNHRRRQGGQVEQQIGCQRVNLIAKSSAKVKIQIQLDGLCHLDHWRRHRRRHRRRRCICIVECREVEFGQVRLSHPHHLGCAVSAGGGRCCGIGRQGQRGQQVKVEIGSQWQIRHAVKQATSGCIGGFGQGGYVIKLQLGKPAGFGRKVRGKARHRLGCGTGAALGGIVLNSGTSHFGFNRCRLKGHGIEGQCLHRQGLKRSARRHGAQQRHIPLPGAQQLGRLHQRVGMEGAGVAGHECLHPALEVAASVATEFAQVVIRSGTGFGQAGVVELLTRPGRITKAAQADHPGTALEGVKSAAHGVERGPIIVARLQFDQRLPGARQHLTRLVKKHLAHFGVVFQTADPDRWRRGGRRLRLGHRRGGQRDCLCGCLSGCRGGAARGRSLRLGRPCRCVHVEHRQAVTAKQGLRVHGQPQPGRTSRRSLSRKVGPTHAALGGTGLLDDAVKLQRHCHRIGVGQTALVVVGR